MAEEGLIRLDAPVCDYLPDYPAETGKKITIRQLLSHTSGIPHHIDAHPDYWDSHDKVFHSPRELWELFAGVPLAHEPGKALTYSSPGFYLLGVILQQVSGKCYAELLTQHIFKPLGMKNSCIENNRTVQKGMAVGYMRGLTGLVRAGFEDKSTALAAGDLVTTTRDLYLWDRGLRADPGCLLSAESKQLLYAPVLPGRTMSIGGPVLRIPYDRGHKTLSVHRLSGSSSGYAAAMDRFLGIDGCVIVLSNVQDAPVGLIVDQVGDFLLRHDLHTPAGAPAPETMTPPPPAPVSEEDVRGFLGFYRDAAGVITGVVKEGGRLYCLVYSGGRIHPPVQELVPESAGVVRFGNRPGLKGRIEVDLNDGRRKFVTYRDGRAVAEARSIDAGTEDNSEYAESYTSVEIQQTCRFVAGREGLKAERFLGDVDLLMRPLGKDVFGFERGLLQFTRDADGTLAGFMLMTVDVEAFLGSRFVRIASD